MEGTNTIETFFTSILLWGLIGAIVGTLWTMLVWRWIFRPGVDELKRVNVNFQALRSDVHACVDQLNQIAVQIYNVGQSERPH